MYLLIENGDFPLPCSYEMVLSSFLFLTGQRRLISSGWRALVAGGSLVTPGMASAKTFAPLSLTRLGCGEVKFTD